MSSEEKDPSLGDGWSFYGKIAPYYNYLAANWSQKQEVNIQLILWSVRALTSGAAKHLRRPRCSR